MTPQNPQQTQQPQQPQQPGPTREREVIVTDGGDRRSSHAGVLIGLLAIVVVAVLGVMFVNALAGSGEEAPVEVPSEVDINVPDPGGDGSGEGGGSGG